MSKKPGQKGGLGTEKDATQTAEAAGRGKRVLYTCWACGANNYIDPDWDHFSCWRCGQCGLLECP